ncbi:MAG: WXG100 family type VII secretion target [Lachnospiraceae bacterium]|nr:WXG100 family type VII secretion target [Lachnospiraceae bacterium]
MAEIYVKSSSELEAIIDELRDLNGKFRNKATDINTEHTQLVTKWEGDASTAFEEHFQKEYPNFENFASAIDEYIQALTDILNEYNTAEDMNKTIAQE